MIIIVSIGEAVIGEAVICEAVIGETVIGETVIGEAVIDDGCNTSDPIVCKYSKFYCQNGYFMISIIILKYNVYSVN